MIMSELPDNGSMLYGQLAQQINELSTRLAGFDAMTKTVEHMDAKLSRLLDWWQQEQVRAQMREIWQNSIESQLAKSREENKALQEQIRVIREEGLKWQFAKSAAVAAGTAAVVGYAQKLIQ